MGQLRCDLLILGIYQGWFRLRTAPLRHPWRGRAVRLELGPLNNSYQWQASISTAWYNI
jgi:hypothetical protein